ncbi:MAG: hypothetical protein DRI57_30700, partial [Deltaproteobacteria bacterium]
AALCEFFLIITDSGEAAILAYLMPDISHRKHRGKALRLFVCSLRLCVIFLYPASDRTAHIRVSDFSRLHPLRIRYNQSFSEKK